MWGFRRFSSYADCLSRGSVPPNTLQIYIVLFEVLRLHAPRQNVASRFAPRFRHSTSYCDFRFNVKFIAVLLWHIFCWKPILWMHSVHNVAGWTAQQASARTETVCMLICHVRLPAIKCFGLNVVRQFGLLSAGLVCRALTGTYTWCVFERYGLTRIFRCRCSFIIWPDVWQLPRVHSCWIACVHPYGHFSRWLSRCCRLGESCSV